jgi:hypothetical protein
MIFAFSSSPSPPPSLSLPNQQNTIPPFYLIRHQLIVCEDLGSRALDELTCQEGYCLVSFVEKESWGTGEE